MSTKLRDLVSTLPEVYQTIYGHPEWDGDASRDCNQRLAVIEPIYNVLAQKLGRPLRVLDLGCAQGFFSLTLASKGATVQGIDFLQENIDVCKALADEHDDFSISFSAGRIEDVIEQLKPRQYDLVIGLSVFHHVVHLHGTDQVKTWLQHLANSVHAVILELALKEEPLYWGPSQPEDSRELIEQCSFYHQVAQFDTHLSDIARPMYVISNDHLIIGNYCQSFTHWSLHPYQEAISAHKGSRRYYFTDDAICKFYYFSTVSGDLLPRESERNRIELEHEVAFLSSPPEGFPAPTLLLNGHNETEGWLVMSRLPGMLLMEKVKQGYVVDVDALISQLLAQLVILEEHGLYHDDVRTWNIVIDDRQTVHLIDYGSISTAKNDCVWPGNIFQSFAILMNEILIPDSISRGFFRPAAISPFNLPTPYANWLFAFWQKPVSDWSFALLHELYLQKSQLPPVGENLSGVERWIGAQEKVLMHNQSHIHQVDALMNDCRDRVTNIERHLEHEVSGRLAALEEQNRVLEQVLLEVKISIQPSLVMEEDDEIFPFTPLPREDLTHKLAEAKQQIAYLAAENARLHTHIQAMTHSRSWRMTSWWRAVGHPVKVVGSQPAGQISKKVIRRSLANTLAFLNRRPALKNRIVKILRATGLYSISIKIYQRCFPVLGTDPVIIESLQDDLMISYNDNSQLPPLVEDIYLKLKS